MFGLAFVSLLFSAYFVVSVGLVVRHCRLGVTVGARSSLMLLECQVLNTASPPR